MKTLQAKIGQDNSFLASFCLFSKNCVSYIVFMYFPQNRYATDHFPTITNLEATWIKKGKRGGGPKEKERVKEIERPATDRPHLLHLHDMTAFLSASTHLHTSSYELYMGTGATRITSGLRLSHTTPAASIFSPTTSNNPSRRSTLS